MSAPEKAYIGIGMPGWLDEPHELWPTEYTRSDMVDAMLAQARREALEEAAREDFLKPLIIEQSEGEWTDDLVAKDVALFQRAIRALIDKEPRQ